jgi:hypothetical protein
MPRSIVRSLARFAAVASVLAVFPACTKSVIVTYPGNNPVEYPWKSCGQDCVNAFAELQETHDPTGTDCEALVTRAVGASGDDRAVAAEMYDSALVLLLRGNFLDAEDRLNRAAALDPDEEYKRLVRQYHDSAAKFPPVVAATPALPPPGPAAPVAAPSAPAVAPAPPAPPAPVPVAAPPSAASSSAPAPVSSALLTPH